MFQPCLAKLPLTLFFPPQDISDKITLSSRLRHAAHNAFDGDSLVLPVPASAAPDVPRIQLESRDKSHVLQLTLQRMIIEWNRRSPAEGSWEADFQNFMNV